MKKHLLRLGAAALFLVFAVCLFPKNTYAAEADADAPIDTRNLLGVCANENFDEGGNKPYRSSPKFIRVYLQPEATYVPDGEEPMITPDYLEITRYDNGTGETKKTKLAWEKFEANFYIYTDKKVVAGHVYDYTFRTYKLVGKKKYYSEQGYKTPALRTYNFIPVCDFKVLSKGNGKSEYFDIKFKSRKGNAPFAINKKRMDADLYNIDHVNEERIKETWLELYAISYDGKSWFPAEENLYIILKEQETIYLRFAYKSGEKFNFDKLESRFYMAMPYLYYNTEYDGGKFFEFSCNNISAKTNEKNHTLEFYY